MNIRSWFLFVAVVFSGCGKRQDPVLSNTYTERGKVWAGLKEYDNAIANYDEAIRLNPKNASAFQNRGAARFEKKEY
ncbi:MAG TPA: tetratricopeptide repeat protein, partial [Gemmata sp.]|nr:tetratricopeptide repeat protein [Gemmata sp.]